MTTKLSASKNPARTARRGSRNMDDGPRRPRCFTAPINAAEFLRDKALRRVQWGVRRQRGVSDIGLLCTRKNCSTLNCMPRGELVDAQNIINKAMTEQSSDMRIRLAKAALKFSQLCVDAHLTLFYEALGKNDPEAKEHCFNALRAGLDIIGTEAFDNPETRYFDDPKTKPWMRAMFALGDFYRDSNVLKSIEIWKKLLACDSADRLNVRRSLVPAFLENGFLVEAAEIIEKFIEEDSTAISLSALLFYWEELGPAPFTELALWDALEINPFILDVLFAGEVTNAQRKLFFTPNSKDDAESFVATEAKSFGPDSPLGKWIVETVEREWQTLKLESLYPGRSRCLTD